MKLAASLLVLAAFGAGGLAAARLGRAPELRAFEARADSIRRADGALLAAFEREGRQDHGRVQGRGRTPPFQTAITPPADLLARR